MNILEKELEDLIYGCLNNDKISLLRERGLGCVSRYDVFKRQADLGSYGRLDFVGFRFNASEQITTYIKSIHVGVFEIKKGEINIDTYLQAARYCTGIRDYIEKRHNWIEASFNIYLIGTSISKDEFSYLPDLVDNLSVYTTSIDLEKGIIFKNENGYRIRDAKLPIEDKEFEATFYEYMKNKTKENFLQSELPF